MSAINYYPSSEGWEEAEEQGYDGPGWYFWDETWTSCNGPYRSEEEAQQKLKHYCDTVLSAGLGIVSNGKSLFQDADELTKAEMEADIQEEEEDHTPPKNEDLTCFKCRDKDTCEFAWDDYNTGGDCLASK